MGVSPVVVDGPVMASGYNPRALPAGNVAPMGVSDQVAPQMAPQVATRGCGLRDTQIRRRGLGGEQFHGIHQVHHLLRLATKAA